VLRKRRYVVVVLDLAVAAAATERRTAELRVGRDMDMFKWFQGWKLQKSFCMFCL
jgi:hypothetical protein